LALDWSLVRASSFDKENLMFQSSHVLSRFEIPVTYFDRAKAFYEAM
jgi:hypothetical protein